MALFSTLKLLKEPAGLGCDASAILITPPVSKGFDPSKTISLVEVGTPASQFAASDQLPLLGPIQAVVCAETKKEIKKQEIKKQKCFINSFGI